MTSGEDNLWRGPFESLGEFESFQDESIAQLARFVLDGPRNISNPDQLKDRVWKLGKFLPAAILGLGRYNPDTTQLYVWENAAAWQRISENSWRNTSGPTILEGQAAYERMVKAWHNVDNLEHLHRFGVEAKFETPYELEIAHSKDSCILTGTWANEAEQRFYRESLSAPDTSRAPDTERDELMDLGSGGALYSQSRPVKFHVSPLRERSDPEDLSEDTIVAIAGQTAFDVLQSHGEVGLYHHLLLTGLRKLVAGVDLGPVKIQ
ncbi:MAG TPA: hypothetical protein VF733_02195 [Candidatus Saccharimonadales bacterium]